MPHRAAYRCVMKINKNETVTFELADISFLQRFGLKEATKMVLDYKSVNKTPFVFDTSQLSNLMLKDKSKMFKVIRNINDYYRPITLKKKNGKVRRINAPQYPLTYMQHAILHKILVKIPVSKYATAYKKGATLYKNAEPHVGKKYLLKLDITDFFGSITFFQVYSAVFNTCRYPKQIGWLLTTLCCKDDVLPQGAATSPAISNIVMKSFDDNIGRWCLKHGIVYTRYCDDMTFSSDEPLFHVYKKVEAMLDEMGFALNTKKTKFVSNGTRQSVTGLTVNEKVSVPRGYKRELRQQLYYVFKHGFDRVACDQICGEKSEPVDCFYRLMGRIGYVLQIEPDNAWFADALEKLQSIEGFCRKRNYYWYYEKESPREDDSCLPF